ncbi:MAG: LysR family transcriptional regulator [Planctomycetota bacterium]|nr:LysR family transcriptional regulator [Planctomycetota bacterium]
MHQLRYFVKVAELRNFTRAAESCNVSQPSLSQQIGKLERELGYPLFERLGRKIVLTDSGEILYEHASRILSHVEEAEVQIQDAAEMGRGKVVIGAIPTIAPYLVPGILHQFTTDYPKAHVEVHELVTADAIRKCLESEIDLILLALPFSEDGLRVESLFEEELFVVLAKNHPLAGKERLLARDIQTEQFVLLNEAHCLSENVLSFCNQKSFTPTVTCQGSQLQTIQELVSVGKGISLIPEMARQLDRSTRRVYRSLAGKQPTRKIVMAWNRNRFQSQPARNLASTIRKICGEMNG